MEPLDVGLPQVHGVPVGATHREVVLLEIGVERTGVLDLDEGVGVFGEVEGEVEAGALEDEVVAPEVATALVGVALLIEVVPILVAEADAAAHVEAEQPEGDVLEAATPVGPLGLAAQPGAGRQKQGKSHEAPPSSVHPKLLTGQS